VIWREGARRIDFHVEVFRRALVPPHAPPPPHASMKWSAALTLDNGAGRPFPSPRNDVQCKALHVGRFYESID
jgi:hypothetical protein